MGLRAFLLLLVITAPAAWYWSLEAALVIAILVGLVVMVVESMRWGIEMLFAVLLATSAALGSSLSAYQYRELSGGQRITDILVAEAAAHPDAQAFTFRDGQVIGEMSGSHVVRLRNSAMGNTVTFYFVAPVVSEGWQPDMPVPLWAVCRLQSSYACMFDWREPHRTGIRVHSIDESDFLVAVHNAEVRHGLTSAPDAPLIEWGASPTDAISSARNGVIMLPPVVFAFWMAGVVIFRLYRRWRSAGD